MADSRSAEAGLPSDDRTGVMPRLEQNDVTLAESHSETVAMRPNEPLEDAARHKIVVVGGGAAGLELVTWLGDRLGRRPASSKLGASVTLVESARTHVWKPLLHEVAAGSMDPGEYELNYLAQAHWHGFRYRLGEMIGLDRAPSKCISPPPSMTRGARSRRHAPSATTRW